MWRRRRFLISILSIALALVAALSTAPEATASDQQYPHGQLVEPSQRIDGLTGVKVPMEAWHRILTLPPAENPWLNNGEECVSLGSHRKILLKLGDVPSCTIRQGTSVYIVGITNWCSNLDDPPFFAESYREQAKCILAVDHSREGEPVSIRVTVDGDKLGDIHQRRYEMLAPSQSHEQLSPDNVFGYPPEIITFVVHGWGAWLVDLPVGTHKIVSRALWSDGFDHVYNPVIKVVR